MLTMDQLTSDGEKSSLSGLGYFSFIAGTQRLLLFEASSLALTEARM